MIALITGGSGCGKSTWAERLVDTLPWENRYYIATMRIYDEESVKRVERHRRQRAEKGFMTLECPLSIDSDAVAEGSTVLLEDLPNWLANEMFDEAGSVGRIVPGLDALARKCQHLIIVSNDVFSDGVIYEASTQEYIRHLAAINRAAAALADLVAEVVYSVPIILKGEAPCV